MGKRIGITLIVIALVIAIAYGVVLITTVQESNIATTTPGEFKASDYKAEIVYSSYMYNTGAYEYQLKASIDLEKITKNATIVERLAREQQSKDSIQEIKSNFEKRGYKIISSDTYSVTAITAYYESYEALALANGYSGYDAPTSSTNTTTYMGVLYNEIVSKRQTVFASIEGTVIEEVENSLSGIDGILEGDVSLVYNYGTMYKTSTITSDADQIYKLIDKESGIFTVVHEFRMDSGNRGRTITLVQTTPNTYTWYLALMVIALLIAGVSILCAGAKKE